MAVDTVCIHSLPGTSTVSESGAEDNPDEIPDLAAEMLTRAVDLRLRRNPSFAFQPTSGDLRRVRGSIDLLRTEQRQLLRRGRVACRCSELEKGCSLSLCHLRLV